MMTKRLIRENVETLLKAVDNASYDFKGRGLELQYYCGKRGNYAVIAWPSEIEKSVYVYELFRNGWYEPPEILQRDVNLITNYIYRKLRPLNVIPLNVI